MSTLFLTFGKAQTSKRGLLSTVSGTAVMPQYKELDTLRSFTAKLNTAISDTQDPTCTVFADLLIEHKLIGESAAKNIVSPLGVPAYNKVSRLMSAVYAYVQTVSSQEKATGIFNTLVVILYNHLYLKDMAMQLVEHRGKDDLSYENPLKSLTEAASVSGETPVPGAGATPQEPRDIMKEQPSLAQLKLLKNKDKTMKVEIIQSVAAQWKDFGTDLDFDKTGTQLDNLEAQYAGRSPVEPCRAMFQYWLQGNGIPATWENVTELLRNCDLCNLAIDVETILQSL